MIALSLQLAAAHRRLRHQITEVRAGLGQRRMRDDTLVTHCLAFCDALTAHHLGEDEGIFTALVAQRPDLAGTIAKLVEDHGMIAAILSRVRELADAAAVSDGAAVEAIRRELDGLAAIMESHFRYEERAVGRALDEDVAEHPEAHRKALPRSVGSDRHPSALRRAADDAGGSGQVHPQRSKDQRSDQ